MNYLNNDELERYWFRYKSEAEPHGTSLERFCQIHKISYKALDNWRRQTKCKIYPVEVYGKDEVPTPVENAATQPAAGQRSLQSKFMSCKHRQGQRTDDNNETKDGEESGNVSSVRVMVNIKATNGLCVFQKNLDYEGLRLLVERLEGLC